MKNGRLEIFVNRLAPLEIEVKNVPPLLESNIHVGVTQIKGTNGEGVIRGTIEDFESKYTSSRGGDFQYIWSDKNVYSIIYLKVPETYNYYVDWLIYQ